MGAIAGSKIGGNVSKTLMELGKQRLLEQQHQTFDQEVARGEAEFDELDTPAPSKPRPKPDF